MTETDPIIYELLELREELRELLRAERAREETGTFTPIYLGSGTAGTFTYTSQIGHYRVIGDLVFFWGTVTISAFSVAPTGNMSISGLPYTSDATAGNISSAYFGAISNIDFSANVVQLVGDIPNSGTAIRLIEVFDNAVNALLPAAQFDNNADASIRFAGFYQRA
jgi:hypothetical protein